MIQPFKVPASVRSLLQEQRGTIAVSAGLAIFVITGFAGLGVDLGYWESVTRNLQGTSDMAAYSAAIAASRSGRSAGITTAYAIGAKAGFVDQQGGVSITVNNPPTRGRYAGNQNGWEVIISQPQKLFFSAAFLSSPPTAAGRACACAGKWYTLLYPGAEPIGEPSRIRSGQCSHCHPVELQHAGQLDQQCGIRRQWRHLQCGYAISHRQQER